MSLTRSPGSAPATLPGLLTGPLTGPLAGDPVRLFAAFLLLHLVVWTALPALLYVNLPLDLIEAVTYGREWQLGYDKLPPLPWWTVWSAYRLFGVDTAYYLIAQITVVVAFAAVFAMARPLIGARGALVAVLILDGLHYFGFTAAKFNHDVIQLPFWAIAGYALHRALRHGRLWHWIVLGLCIGISLWAKYFVVVLAVPMLVFAAINRDARRCLATPGPYIAVSVALIVMAPHLIWLVRNDFLPFAYAEHRAAVSHGAIGHLFHPVQFAVGQLFFLLPLLLIASPLVFPRTREPRVAAHADDFDRRIVAWLAFGPFISVVLLALVTGRGAIAMWGYPIWLYLGVWMVLNAGRALDGLRYKRIVGLWSAVFAILAVVFFVSYAVMPRFDHRYRAVFYPGAALAKTVTDQFHAATGQPLAYVIGSMWEGGNIGHYSADHPRVLIDGRPERAPWISLSDLARRGGIVVWQDEDLTRVPDRFRAIAPNAQVQTPLHIPFRHSDRTLDAGWAILPPAP